MKTKLIFKNVLFGFLSWLIPFVASFFFFKPNGEMFISNESFKSIMIVVGSLSGCFLLFLYFKNLESDFIWNGFIVGISWFLINIVFDTLILIPMMKVTFDIYFMTIGLRYIVLPAMSITIGYLLDRKLNR